MGIVFIERIMNKLGFWRQFYFCLLGLLTVAQTPDSFLTHKVKGETLD